MKDLNQRGIENQTEGTAKEIKGNIRKNVGDAFDNESEQLKGSAEELEGKVQKNFGKAERKLDPDNR
ncbi:MAG: CsbD family protein [Gemmatimonadaceae bacterium]